MKTLYGSPLKIQRELDDSHIQTLIIVDFLIQSGFSSPLGIDIEIMPGVYRYSISTKEGILCAFWEFNIALDARANMHIIVEGWQAIVANLHDPHSIADASAALNDVYNYKSKKYQLYAYIMCLFWVAGFIAVAVIGIMS